MAPSRSSAPSTLPGNSAKTRLWIMFAGNATLTIGHFIVFAVTHSRLVLAQGADSLMDVGVTAILAFSASVGAKERDQDHPFGHGRAEPVGALISAVLAGVLVVEVAKSAMIAAWAHEVPVMDNSVLGVLAAKFVVKCVFVLALARAASGPAVRAVIADSKNDLATILACTLGYFAVRAGWSLADPILALFICGYIARNAYAIFRENLRYLMGEAPDPDLLHAMKQAAGAIPGVLEVRALNAHHVGSQLHVEVVIRVAGDAATRETHDLAERVQQAIEARDDVARAFVHVDV
jgi:cation diffusion facilitator family transporter